MAPPASATARRAPARPAPRPTPATPRRPPLRLFEPAPRRKAGPRAVQRSTMWISGLLIVGSLLAVVVGDALITQGQVRLSATQRALAVAEANQKTLQTKWPGKAAPDRRGEPGQEPGSGGGHPSGVSAPGATQRPSALPDRGEPRRDGLRSDHPICANATPPRAATATD